MKKFFIILSIFLTIGILVGCKNSTDDDDSEELLWQNKENGFTEKIILKTTFEDGISNQSLTYSIQEDVSGKVFGFGILRMKSENSIIYKAIILARRKSESFPDSYWNRYQISLGQKTLSLSNALSDNDYEDDFYEFMIVGGVSDYGLNELKQANELNISLTNTDFEERYTSIDIDYEFILNLIKYF